MHSSLYIGRVNHRRFTPREHHFNYSLFMLYLDLDELPTLFQRFWFWSNDRSNLASFRRKDHLGDKQTSLKTSVCELVEERTGRRPNGPVRLLTSLGYFGFRFNPVSFYYCFNEQDDVVEYIVAEVNNTPWGEQHCYVMDANNNQGTQQFQRYFAEKQFHVSPFMPMDIDYDWRFSAPEEKLSVHMENHREGQKIFDATLALNRQPITHKKLAGVLIRFPLMTMKVVAAIYFEAIRLWLKCTPLFDHPGNSPQNQKAPNPVKTS